MGLIVSFRHLADKGEGYGYCDLFDVALETKAGKDQWTNQHWLQCFIMPLMEPEQARLSFEVFFHLRSSCFETFVHLSFIPFGNIKMSIR